MSPGSNGTTQSHNDQAEIRRLSLQTLANIIYWLLSPGQEEIWKQPLAQMLQPLFLAYKPELGEALPVEDDATFRAASETTNATAAQLRRKRKALDGQLEFLVTFAPDEGKRAKYEALQKLLRPAKATHRLSYQDEAGELMMIQERLAGMPDKQRELDDLLTDVGSLGDLLREMIKLVGALRDADAQRVMALQSKVPAQKSAAEQTRLKGVDLLSNLMLSLRTGGASEEVIGRVRALILEAQPPHRRKRAASSNGHPEQPATVPVAEPAKLLANLAAQTETAVPQAPTAAHASDNGATTGEQPASGMKM